MDARNIHALQVFLDEAKAMYLTSASTLCLFAYASTAFRRAQPLDIMCRRWLRCQESGRGSLWARSDVMYREYHAARLLRCFLQRVGSGYPNAVISGSYALAMFLESEYGCAWRPLDIDVWTCSLEGVDYISQLFVDMVLTPLGVGATCDSWSLASLRAESDRDGEAERRRSVPDVCPMKHACVRTDVRDWLTMYSSSNWNVDTNDLFATLDHLPRRFQARSLLITSTEVVKPVRRRKFLPACILPINVISVDIGDQPDLGAAICSNFDLSACCIELRVENDHRFTFRCHGTARSDALGGVLRLMPCSFASGQPHAQMYRIAKYLERGFSWRPL